MQKLHRTPCFHHVLATQRAEYIVASTENKAVSAQSTMLHQQYILLPELSELHLLIQGSDTSCKKAATPALSIRSRSSSSERKVAAMAVTGKTSKCLANGCYGQDWKAIKVLGKWLPWLRPESHQSACHSSRSRAWLWPNQTRLPLSSFFIFGDATLFTG